MCQSSSALLQVKLVTSARFGSYNYALLCIVVYCYTLLHLLLNDTIYPVGQVERRKTISGDDLLWAMSTLGFEKYIEPLRLYLGKFREGERAVVY